MNVLLTGASGFLGTHVCELLDDSYEKSFLSTRHDSTSTVFLKDVTDVDAVQAIFESRRPEVVVHLAGLMKGDNEDLFFRVNAYYAQTLLKAIQRTGSKSKLIFVGSAAEYGSPSCPNTAFSETDDCQPISVYGRSKLLQTKFALAAADQGVEVCVLRLFNLLGPGQDSNFILGKVTEHIKRVRSGDQVTDDLLQTGDLSASRDFIDVRTAATAIKYVVDNDVASGGEIFNICSGRPAQIRKLVERAFELAGLPALVSERRVQSSVENDVVYGDNSKWTKCTGISLDIDLEQTLLQMLS